MHEGVGAGGEVCGSSVAPQKFNIPDSGVILAPKGMPADEEGLLP